jgi:hypothetical protein
MLCEGNIVGWLSAIIKYFITTTVHTVPWIFYPLWYICLGLSLYWACLRLVTPETIHKKLTPSRNSYDRDIKAK